MAAFSESSNHTIFRDCFSSALLQRVSLSESKPRKMRATKGRTKAEINRTKLGAILTQPEANNNSQSVIEQSNVADDLADFTEFLASETFAALPDEIQQLSYSQVQACQRLAETYSSNSVATVVEQILPTIPVSVTESIETYAILAPGTSFGLLFSAALTSYLESATASPPVWSTTRTSACEICTRDWVPLTYHHLIPKAVHVRVLKRGWHEKWQLNSVAWLCRACHSFVHRVASNEELARYYWSVERLLERDDILDWAKWVCRVRWKAS